MRRVDHSEYTGWERWITVSMQEGMVVRGEYILSAEGWKVDHSEHTGIGRVDGAEISTYLEYIVFLKIPLTKLFTHNKINQISNVQRYPQVPSFPHLLTFLCCVLVRRL